MQPSCAQVSAKSILTGALTPERAFVHSCVHGYHGSWLDIIHPFSTLGLDDTGWDSGCLKGRPDGSGTRTGQTTGKIRENDNTWLDDQPLLPGRI
ncbi:unnamed protein product [Brassica oleracea var. botrytis]